jgi:hypothetical protein
MALNMRSILCTFPCADAHAQQAASDAAETYIEIYVYPVGSSSSAAAAVSTFDMSHIYGQLQSMGGGSAGNYEEAPLGTQPAIEGQQVNAWRYKRP